MNTFTFGDGRDWFFEKRFGLFLHFGIYAVEGWHEQEQQRRCVPRAEYEKLIHRFNPVGFDADAILDLAESVGMEYVCLTTKHHDGFCLWDTAYTDYNVMNTPYGKDIVRQLHPNYPGEGRSHELQNPEPGDAPDLYRYLAYLKNQVRELCENYGPVHHFFWDMNNVPKFEDPNVNGMLRSLQPDMVINDQGFDEGDFGGPEREYEEEQTHRLLRFNRPTEACNSVGTQSWGYRRDEDYYSARFLMQSIDEIMAKGGNYLLNAGPDHNGCIPEPALALLRKIGDWYSRVKEAFCGCEPASELTGNRDVLITRKGTTLYVHIARLPKSEAVVLNPIRRRPSKAVLLNTGDPVETSVDLLPTLWESGPLLRLKHLPVDNLLGEPLVIRLDFPEREKEGVLGES
jgi:alpha-L-fucosidase